MLKQRSALIVTLIVFFVASVGNASADFTDTFTAADGTDLTTHNAIYSVNSPLTIQDNSITPNTHTVSIAGNEFTDGCMSMDWTDNSDNTNMQIRHDGGNDFYGFIQFNGNWRLYRSAGNVDIDSGSLDFSGTHNYKLCAIGSTITVYRDNVELGSGTDTSIAGSGYQAFFSLGNKIDNLAIEVLDGDGAEVKIVASPPSGTKTVGTPFNVDVKVEDGGAAFNAARATVDVSSNLSITGIHNATSNACNLQYTQTPTTSNPSYAGAIFGGSKNDCTVYTLTLTPTSTGTGTVTFTNGSIKSFSNNSEILTGVQNGSFTVSAPSPTATPPGTTLVSIDDSVLGSNQNQWNYNGGWSHCTDSGNPACNPSSIYNTSISWDNTINDYATVTFTGTQISLYGLVDPNHGTGAVSIDGGAETTVDFQSGTRTGDTLLWTSPILTPGVHTFKIRVANGYIAPDRVDILQTSQSGLTVTNTSFDTYGSTFTLLGTKDASLTSIFVNNSSANASYPTSTTWQSVESLVLGNNAFVIYGKDANDVQTASINVTINRHTLGDINGDGLVDLTDVSLFAVDWDKTSNLTYNLSDMNGDGNVNLTDLSILAKLEQ